MFKKRKCPKCGSRNLNKVAVSSWKKAQKASMFLLFWPLALLMGRAKDLNVCRDCGFSWEDR